MTYTVDYAPLAAVFFVLLVLAVIIIVALATYGRKSRQYRKLITDLYVVGKIKQMAAEDKVDLKAEEKAFLKSLKSDRSRLYDLDEVIEAEINERVGITKEK